jgi:hypothetical protein
MSTDHYADRYVVFSNPYYLVLGPNSFLNIIFSHAFSYVPPLVWEARFHVRVKKTDKIIKVKVK